MSTINEVNGGGRLWTLEHALVLADANGCFFRAEPSDINTRFAEE